MDFSCEFSFKTNGSVDKYSCNIKQPGFFAKNTEIRSIKGEHQEEKGDIDVECLVVDQFKHFAPLDFNRLLLISEFPSGIYKFFPHLTDLTLRHCGLNKITRQVLLGLDNLETLNLSGNKLTSLPDDLFINKRKLRSIDFTNNQIVRMSSKLLKSLHSSLETVLFTKNLHFNEKFVKNKSEGSFEDFLRKIDEKCAPKIKTDATKDHLRKLTRLLSSGMLSDFVVKVGEKEFKVHKSILAIQSSVFEAMFGSEMQENLSGLLKITDYSISAIEDFLLFLYSGKVKDHINATELFTLACKYDVPDLKEICKHIILANIDDTNAIEILRLGHLYCCETLKVEAFNRIEAHVGYDIQESLIDNPEKLQELVDALKKMNSLKEECKRT